MNMTNLFAATFALTTVLLGMIFVPGFRWFSLISAFFLCVLVALYLPVLGAAMRSLREGVGDCERPSVDMAELVGKRERVALNLPTLSTEKATIQTRSSLAKLVGSNFFGVELKR